jgi:hypothetical protein
MESDASLSLGKKDAIAALLLVVLAFASWLPRLQGPIDLRWDGGAYYVLGSSLAQGKGYRLLNEPGEIQSSLHPPMLPVIVALHQWILGTSDFVAVGVWLRRFYLALFILYVVASFVMLRIFLPLGYAAPAALVCLFQLHTILLSDLCFPEIPFGLATVLFTLCNLKKRTQARRFWSASLAVISFALRTIGAALLAAWTVESILRRNFKQAAGRLLFAVAVVLAWTGYIVSVESGPEYQTPAYSYQRAAYNYINVSYARNLQYRDPFSPELGRISTTEKIQRLLHNLRLMPASLGEAVSARAAMWDVLGAEFHRRMGIAAFPPWVVRLPLFLLAILIAVGISILWKRGQYFIPLYILFSLMMVFATPWPGQYNRYLAPLAPFFSLSLFLAAQAAARRLSQSLPARSGIAGRTLAGALLLLIFASQGAALWSAYTSQHQRVAYEHRDGKRIDYRLFFYQARNRMTDDGLDWLKAHAKGDETIAATDPQWCYLRTGLKSVLPPFEMDAQEAQRLLDGVPVRYLVVDDGVYKKYTERVAAASPNRWRRVYAQASSEGPESKVEIYERTPED